MRNTKRSYSSKKLKFSIHRKSELIPVIIGGKDSFERVNKPPVEFKNGRFETADPEVQAFLADHHSNGVDFYENASILKTAGTKAPEAKAKAEATEDAAPAEDVELEVIEDVSNKNDAIAALVERGVSADSFGAKTTKSTIVAVAADNGFGFADW